jgi:hypothetical protein
MGRRWERGPREVVVRSGEGQEEGEGKGKGEGEGANVQLEC